LIHRRLVSQEKAWCTQRQAKPHQSVFRQRCQPYATAITVCKRVRTLRTSESDCHHQTSG
jgi:hypothetical protein